MNITVTILTCQRCGHTWPPRKPDVRICPKCKSARWDTPKGGEAMNAPADWKKVHPDYTVKRAYIFAHGKGSSCTRKAWRVMLTVAEYSTAQYRQPCPDCGREREGHRIEGRVSENHKCGAKCRSSKGWQCECSCGGANHGAGFDVQEPEVTRIPDIDTMRYDAMGMDIGE